MPAFNDITGKRFGRLLVIRVAERKTGKRKPVKWLCQCDCGKQILVHTSNLTGSKSKSCGCLRFDNVPPNKTHGMSETVTFNTWSRMLDRCYNKNNKSHHNYGGRGIQVCLRWQGPSGFVNFLEDMGERPSEKHSLDRIDNEGHYAPNNCRWATRLQQANNKRNNVILEYKGEKRTMGEWSRIVKIPIALIWDRIFVRHWDVSDALSKKPRPIKRQTR